MWRTLLTGPWPDADEGLPAAARTRAAEEIRRYWVNGGWQLVLGEIVIWAIIVYRAVPYPHVYAVLVGLISFAYLLGTQSRYLSLWLIGHLVLFMLRGLLINGLSAVTALSYLLPYNIAAILLPGRKRFWVQAACIVAFWASLVYDAFPFFNQLRPPLSIVVSYNVLLAAFTFQTLRFLNRLSVEITSDYITDEIQQRSQRFLARVSHELRTPLNSVLGFAKLLRHGSLTDNQQRYLNQIIDESEHLNRLVSDLLDSAHLATGELKLNPEPCDINTLCQAIAEEQRPNLPEAVTLDLKLSPNLPLLSADPVRLRQAIGNLVSNAIKYTEQGEVSIKTTQRDQFLLIEVRDTGIGIPESQQKMIFVPFVQLDNRRIGVGLGLDIALQLVRLHGGQLHLQSAPGQGSSFTIELPLI